ncbi:short-chain dehydrogenase reductase family [Colletotrichum kahawae]|uniref:Short-chain dehydrogenase reductase family n=1 Tax=Colletotrichum kahawae TaxID=34407 RepID=A0AAD9Y3A3_COLKA|nr:short-chain dehydrogenase reductase family [Colletotrichum kahawae]
MASFDPSKFDGLTPGKAAGLPRFFYHQLTFKPEVVKKPRLEGKTAIVTGSNTGVGLETARQLLDLGVTKLILAVRNEEKGAAAATKITAGRQPPVAPGTVEVWRLDLCDYDSVVAFAGRCQKELLRLDIAILNAGMNAATLRLNPKTGHEETIQVNYLSTALLALLLLPVVKAKRVGDASPPRITIVNSEVSAWTRFTERNEVPLLPTFDKTDAKVDMLDRMMISKLLGQFFLVELAKRVPPSIALINACSPATVHDTEFQRELDGTLSGTIIKAVQRRFANKSPVGACMITDAAVRHGEETHGQFLSFQTMIPLAPIVYSPEGQKISERLWEETMTELAFAKPEEILKNVVS